MALLVVTLTATSALAGVADSPLPILQGTTAARNLFQIPGVVKSDTINTLFVCTSMDSTTMRIGVEIWGTPGNGPINNVVAGDGAIDVPPGGTVTIGTGNTAAFTQGTTIGVGNGSLSARIVGTSTKVICRAFLTDSINAPPTSMLPLTVITKKKQIGD